MNHLRGQKPQGKHQVHEPPLLSQEAYQTNAPPSYHNKHIKQGNAMKPYQS